MRHHILRQPAVNLRGRYDAAQTTDENRRTWAMADAYDADACNNAAVRTILRNRARYVFANNPRARGMILTLANDTVGVGPRLDMMLGEGAQAKRINERIEASFRSWAKEVKLAKKLRILRLARVISGEIFAVLAVNPRLSHDVKLDVQLIETDQVHDPAPGITALDVDGVFLDEYGNPDRYRVLKVHPGGMFVQLSPGDYEDLPARFVCHYFGADRPGQHRGIPEITPAVQLVEEGRRFRAAVLGAAETAADFAMALQSDAPPDPDAAESAENGITAMDTVELSRRLATVLPQGWKLTQTKAEQPTTTYKEFARELLAEVARCLQMPLSIASLDANDANMSSSYVINQPYRNAIEVERDDIETDVLDPLLDLWLTLSFDPQIAPLGRRIPNEFPHKWSWPAVGQHADPAKVATARLTDLSSGATNLAREAAREGLDWEEEQAMAAKTLGLSVEDYQALLRQKIFGPVTAAAPQDNTGDSNATDNPNPGRDGQAG